MQRRYESSKPAHTAACQKALPIQAVLRADYVEPQSVFKLPRSLLKAVGIMAVSQLVISAGFGVIVPILPTFASDIGLGPIGIGTIVSAPSAVRVLTNLHMGAWADKYGRKLLMVVGTAASALAGFGTAFATSFLTIMPFRLLAGVGSSASMVGASAFMADLTAHTPRHRAKLLGMQQSIVSMSFVAGPAVGGALAEAYGAQAAFYAVGASALVCSLGYSFLPETLRHPVKIFGGRRAAPTDAAAAVAPAIAVPAAAETVAPPPPPPPPPPPAVEEKLTWRALLSNPTQRAVLAIEAACCICYAAQVAVVPLYVSQTFGLGAGQIGFMFSLASCSGIVGAPLGGWMADKFGRRFAIALPTVAAAATAFALTVSTTTPSFTALMIVWSLSLSMLEPGLAALAADIAPKGNRGAALSLAQQASDATFAIAPIALGTLAAFVSNQAALAAVGGLVSIFVTYFLRRTTSIKRPLFQK